MKRGGGVVKKWRGENRGTHQVNVADLNHSFNIIIKRGRLGEQQKNGFSVKNVSR